MIILMSNSTFHMVLLFSFFDILIGPFLIIIDEREHSILYIDFHYVWERCPVVLLD